MAGVGVPVGCGLYAENSSRKRFLMCFLRTRGVFNTGPIFWRNKEFQHEE